MLTKELLQSFCEVLDYAIENTAEVDLKHANKKLFQLFKNDKPLGVFFTMDEIAIELDVDLKLIRRLREKRNCKLYNIGYRITTIEYKH